MARGLLVASNESFIGKLFLYAITLHCPTNESPWFNPRAASNVSSWFVLKDNEFVFVLNDNFGVASVGLPNVHLYVAVDDAVSQAKLTVPVPLANEETVVPAAGKLRLYAFKGKVLNTTLAVHAW